MQDKRLGLQVLVLSPMPDTQSPEKGAAKAEVITKPWQAKQSKTMAG